MTNEPDYRRKGEGGLKPLKTNGWIHIVSIAELTELESTERTKEVESFPCMDMSFCPWL